MTVVLNKHAFAFAELVNAYNKALLRFANADPSPAAALKTANTKRDDVINFLESSEGGKAIDKAIQGVTKDDLKKTRKDFDEDQEEFREEMAIAGDFGFSKNDFLRHFEICGDAKRLNEIGSVKELIQLIHEFHTNYIANIDKSRNLPRVDKKSLKNANKKAATKTLLGVGCAGLNAFTGTMPMSYFVALNFFVGAADAATEGRS